MPIQDYQLVYYSRNEMPLDADFDQEVEGILSVSRRNNEADRITGTLIFNQGIFAQVLEGPLPSIEQTFERIQQDPRHGEVSLLAIEPIKERAFGHWSMGYVGRSEASERRFAKLGIVSNFDPTRLNGHQLHAILRDLTLGEELAV